MRIAVLGYLCRDRNVLPNGNVSEIVGGKGLFGAAAIAQSGAETDLITWLPESDAELCLSLSAYPVTIHVIPIPHGTVNTNTHNGDTTIAATVLDPTPVEPAHLNPAMRSAIQHSDLVLLAPDIQEKISLDTIRYVSHTVGVPIAADIGKYFRRLQPDGQLVPKFPWRQQAEFLQHFNTVFFSGEDVRPALASGESLLSIARQMAEQGPAEVIITRGSQGSFIFSRDTNEGFDAPAYPPRKLVDPTGAGDTFIGTYVARRLQSDNLFEAGRFASMAAGLKLNYAGPLRETAELIDHAIAETDSGPAD